MMDQLIPIGEDLDLTHVSALAADRMRHAFEDVCSNGWLTAFGDHDHLVERHRL